VIVGGGGAKRTPRLAAAYADEFNIPPFHNFDDVAPQYDRVRAACEAVGRDPGTIKMSAAVTVCCGADEAELAARARAIGQSVEQVRAGSIAGTPDEVVDRIRAYAKAGADCLYLQVLDLADLDHIALLGEAVLPQVS